MGEHRNVAWSLQRCATSYKTDHWDRYAIQYYINFERIGNQNNLEVSCMLAIFKNFGSSTLIKNN